MELGFFGLMATERSSADCGGCLRAFADGYEKAANQVAGLSFIVVFVKPDDLHADPVIYLLDALR